MTTQRMHCTVQSYCHLDNNKRNVQQGAKHACLRSYTIIRAGLSNFLFTRYVFQLPWQSSLLPCFYMRMVLTLTPLKPLRACFLRTAPQRAGPPQVEKHPSRARQRRCLPAALWAVESHWRSKQLSAQAHISIRFTVSEPFINLASCLKFTPELLWAQIRFNYVL